MPEQSLRDKINKEFGRPLFSGWDWQFAVIWISTLLIEVVFIVVMAGKPPEEYSQAEISRIQEQFANFIMAEDEKQENAAPETVIGLGESASSETDEPAEPEESGRPAETERETERQPSAETGGGGEPGAVRTAESQAQTRQAAAAARRESREAMSRSVSSKGLLGMLTGTGSAAQGEAVDNVLGGSRGNGGNRDLDQILSSVDGLQTQGEGGLGGSGGTGSGIGNVRGSRSGGPTSIDDLVSDRTDLATASMSRQGDLVLENPSDVIGRGNKSAYRSPDAIREVMLGHVPAIQYCYERELKRDPGLKGKVSVRITVSADGPVTAVEILDSTLNNTRVERCILARIRLWKDFRPIDPTEGNITFRQVYAFGV